MNNFIKFAQQAIGYTNLIFDNHNFVCDTVVVITVVCLTALA